MLFDVCYDQYEDRRFVVPDAPRAPIEGETITGTILLHFDRIFSGQALASQTFRITPPGHFAVEEVE